MVGTSSLITMALTAMFSLILPIALLVLLYVKTKVSIKPFFIGCITFVVFVLILERNLHIFVINKKLIPGAVSFAIYGALAAGIFEEIGRYMTMKLFLKKNHSWQDGIAFGLGHGGIEAILICTLANIQALLYSNLINNGLFEKTLSGKIPDSVIAQLKSTLLSTPSFMYAVSGLERVFAITAHIAFSLLVLYSIKNKKNIFLVLAIFFHAVLDFPAALYQTHIIKNIWIIEAYCFIFSAVALIFIIRSMKLFNINKIIDLDA